MYVLLEELARLIQEHSSLQPVGHCILALGAVFRRRDGSPRVAVSLRLLGVWMGRDKLCCLLGIDVWGPHLHISRFFL